MSRQALVNIITKSWKEVQIKAILKGFKLTRILDYLIYHS